MKTHPNSNSRLLAQVVVVESALVEELGPEDTTRRHNFRYTDLHWHRKMHQHDSSW